MAAKTAFIQIGNPHPNSGGLETEAMLSFSEGDRCAWVLQTRNESNKERAQHAAAKVWIPTVDHALEDGLLMAACFMEPTSPVKDLFGHKTGGFNTPRFDLSMDIDSAVHQEILETLRAENLYKKYVIHVLDGSHISTQLGNLYKYQMAVEVTMSVFRKEYSMWGISGSAVARFP